MKTSRFELRLDERLRRYLFELASEAQQTQEPNCSEYIRDMLLEKHDGVNKEILCQLHELENQIKRIGNNVNQIARAVNTDYFTSADREWLFQLMQEVWDEEKRIEEIVKRKRMET